jgi:glycosyltransferase involved in cell wall biosynthesis
MTVLYVVVPEGIDDPARPSGGNVYDRRICLGLAGLGWTVHERQVAGAWPAPDADARARLEQVLADIPDDAMVLIDGLIASTVPEVLAGAAPRLRVVVLVHMPLGSGTATDAVRVGERAALRAAAAVVTTSQWTRQWLISSYALPHTTVHAVPPGVSTGELVTGTAAGGELLCVAAVTPGKGHDVLLEALTTLTDLPWRCTCVGSAQVATAFAGEMHDRATRDGLAERVSFRGALVGEDLDHAFAAADVLVLPSRAETYAMVVTEALARGLPIIASDVGGVPESLGETVGYGQPGLLVAPGDADALAGGLRRWLVDAALRQRLRDAARHRRGSLTDWSVTAEQLSWVLKDTA